MNGKVISKGPINNTPALVQIMAWRQLNDIYIYVCVCVSLGLNLLTRIIIEMNCSK